MRKGRNEISIVILKNNISKSENGVFVNDGGSPDNNIISDNTLINNENGIFLYKTISNSIVNNSLLNNTKYGIEAHSYSNTNIINMNNFSENFIHAKDDGYGNQWDNGSIGNYWDNYTGVDADDNGIGEVPYTYIFGSAENQDNYPIWRDGDDISPQITINTPNPNDLTGKKSPTFNIKITDQTLNSTWYRLWNGTILTTNTSFEYPINNKIDQSVWDKVLQLIDEGIFSLPDLASYFKGMGPDDMFKILRHSDFEFGNKYIKGLIAVAILKNRPYIDTSSYRGDTGFVLEYPPYWQIAENIGLTDKVRNVMSEFVKTEMGGIRTLARLMTTYKNGDFILFPYLRSYAASLIRYCDNSNELLNALNLGDHDETTIFEIFGTGFEQAKLIYSNSFLADMDEK